MGTWRGKYNCFYENNDNNPFQFSTKTVASSEAAVEVKNLEHQSLQLTLQAVHLLKIVQAFF